jgi:hypothetical protein
MRFSLTVLSLSVLFAVLLNLSLPLLAKQFATNTQKNDQMKDMNLWNQIVSMLYHHSMVPVSSSLIVAAIVAISVLLADLFDHHYISK